MKQGITRKRWTTEEETELLEFVDRLKNNGCGWQDGAIFEELSGWDNFTKRNRTAAALQKRYAELTTPRGKEELIKVYNEDVTYKSFLDSIQDLKNSYQMVVSQNEQLRKRVAELEQKESDFNMMVKIMEQARKMIVNEELGEHEKPRFKMDGNGNLERVK